MIYYILGFVTVIITTLAEVFINICYGKYKNVSNNKNVSGFDAAKIILEKNNIDDIYVVETKGYLSDHYDSSAKAIRLSSDIYHNESIASCAVAAHEVGHAIQDKEGNTWMKIRRMIYPVVNFSSKFGYAVIFLGLVFGVMEVFYAGIILLSMILLFQLVTLPVEFDASRKAIKNLEKLNILDNSELEGASKVLKAAAFTYVASLSTTFIEILRLLILTRERDD